MKNNSVEIDSRLRIVLIVANEYYYIPMFLRELIGISEIDLSLIISTQLSLGKQSPIRFGIKLFRRFGISLFVKHMTFYLKYRILDLLNRYRTSAVPYSPKSVATKNNIDYHHTNDVNSDDVINLIQNYSPHIIVSVAATQKFNERLIDSPQLATINVHSSLLPKYRGVSPGFWAMLNNEDQTGISIHYMNEDIDSGDLIKQKPIEISQDETLHELNSKVAVEGAKLLHEVLQDFESGNVYSKPIDINKGSYYSLPTKEDIREFLTNNKFY